MAYLSRQNIGKFWAIPRKGTKYLAVATHNQKESVPLVIVMRDILKLVRNKKELQRLLNEKQILINHKEIREPNFPITLFDKISFPNIKKNYVAKLSLNKKMIFKEIPAKDSETKTYKVLSKKILGSKKIQLNLSGGKNILSDEKVETGDSILLNLKDNKIIKTISMEKGKNAFVLKGKHAGIEGEIVEIVNRGGKEIAKISFDKEKINVWIKNIIVTE